MKRNRLGNTNIEISEIGLGTWELSGNVWGIKDDIVSKKALHVGLDQGVNFIDTAAGYGKGHAEELVGQVIRERKGKTGEIIVSTKVLPKCGIFAPSPEKAIEEFYPQDWIVEQCDASLKRLQTERIDILFLHTWSPSWGHNDEWYEVMQELKKQGKIGAIGISITDEGIADANVHIEAGRLDVVECVYNIFQQEPEYTLFPLADKHNVGIIARSPFSSGALIGNWTKNMIFQEGDWRNSWPKLIHEDNWVEEQVEMAELVKPILAKEKIAMPLAAIKYILMNKVVTSVIPGSANPEHVIDNISVINTPGLSQNSMELLKQLWIDGKIHGTYNGSI